MKVSVRKPIFRTVIWNENKVLLKDINLASWNSYICIISIVSDAQNPHQQPSNILVNAYLETHWLCQVCWITARERNGNVVPSEYNIRLPWDVTQYIVVGHVTVVVLQTRRTWDSREIIYEILARRTFWRLMAFNSYMSNFIDYIIPDRYQILTIVWDTLSLERCYYSCFIITISSIGWCYGLRWG